MQGSGVRDICLNPLQQPFVHNIAKQNSISLMPTTQITEVKLAGLQFT